MKCMERTRPFLSYAVLLFLARSCYAVSPPVQVELQSSWPAPPPLLECIETIALEEPEAFFPLIDVLTNPQTRLDPVPSTPKAVHQHALETALAEGFLSTPGVLAAVEMHLALHSASPKIEAFYQYYTDRRASMVEEQNDGKCGSWVDWYGQVVCDVKMLEKLMTVETMNPTDVQGAQQPFARPKLMPFDHIHPPPERTLESPPHTAVLYASPSSDNFRALHSFLYAASNEVVPRVEYVLRPIPEAAPDMSRPMYLSGYGVSLDLKKMDYLALDDRRQGSSSEEDTVDEAVAALTSIDPITTLLQQYPENTTLDPSTPLTEDELLEIGIQATQLIYNSEAPLSTLIQLSQNLPKYATSLARRVSVRQDLKDEVQNNHARVAPGANMAWLNGMVLQEKDLNPFSLLRLLRKERGTMLALTSLGLSPGQAVGLLTHPAIGDAQSGSSVLNGIVDASDRPEGGGVIVWLNDFENDPRYARWTRSLHLLLRPMYPGQFPAIRANIFNIVLVVDLSQTSSIQFLSVTVSNIINRSFPFRWGVVPVVETEEGAMMARLFYYLSEHLGSAKTIEFLRHIAQADKPMEATTPTVNWPLVRSTYRALLASNEAGENIESNLDAILSGSVPTSNLEKARGYSQRLRATLVSAGQGHAFVNGKHFDLDDTFLRSMQAALAEQMIHLQERVGMRKLTDQDLDTISTYFYDQPTTAKRRNVHIYPSGKVGDLRIYSLFDLIGKSGFPHGHGSFVYPSEPELVPLTTYVVGDFDSEEGLLLLKEVLTAAGTEFPSRVSFIHNPASVSKSLATQARPPISSLLAHLTTKGTLREIPPSRLLKVLGFDTDAQLSPSSQVVILPADNADDVLGKTVLSDEELSDYISSSRLIVRYLKLTPGQQALIVNGRMLGPIGPGEFAAEDFSILAAYEIGQRVQPVIDALEGVQASFTDADRSSYTEVISLVSSLISAIQLSEPSEVGLFNAPQNPRQRNYQHMDGDFTTHTFGDNTTALHQFGFVIDPLSEVAQKLSSLIQWLLNIPSVFVEMHISPAQYRELPLKRFYRYNLQPRVSFEDDGHETQVNTEFTGLPIDPIYTLAMDVPQSWLARPREAPHDLDNILLSALPAQDRAHGVRAVFELGSLVIEGHSRDILTGAPPRGVQLQLVTDSSTAIADTQVVANLGYLQFRTKPGVFHLEIRPGRGREIFIMESVGNEGWNSPPVQDIGNEVTLTSFEGLVLYPRLARLPGMERMDVLTDVSATHAGPKQIVNEVISRVSSFFSGTRSTELSQSGSDQAEINIFTVASGLLYERFASIMVLSVLRNTKSSVKFWFIENFLSPSFLEFLPHFAEAYGFQYELVTYKWPSWLRAQKEKQRIIWAYKILFLDVLFPMDLKKVIFVDADQIVRADLKELVDLDLHGAPYAYTPMGDDNVEMEGFRFWKTGYWKEFLRGLPYHISALYVVDLVRFRQVAAGDILRGHYQQLSADPNSLANLDQDLPNNLQREVPIFSLPEDWLWCETWCSKDRLHRAKTIDLCQNPLTKEPKLVRARQIPEWEEYDSEIAQFARKLAEDGKMHSGIVAADVNVLADASSGRAVPSLSSGKGEPLRDEL